MWTAATIPGTCKQDSHAIDFKTPQDRQYERKGHHYLLYVHCYNEFDMFIFNMSIILMPMFLMILIMIIIIYHLI